MDKQANKETKNEKTVEQTNRWADEMKDGHTDKQMKGKRKTVE